ncbi:hypothetical protein B0H15DRAFT_69761 [Mycena belliarum]|uniref:Uncharacterized protein n=1 Tax=Mycena belliarum TaxID=1033014 RepID=A0AAD6UCU6_9AGAR|nr:hypothetical protein B0H15DRAFT_69761 [Mycena belliae]
MGDENSATTHGGENISWVAAPAPMSGNVRARSSALTGCCPRIHMPVPGPRAWMRTWQWVDPTLPTLSFFVGSLRLRLYFATQFLVPVLPVLDDPAAHRPKFPVPRYSYISIFSCSLKVASDRHTRVDIGPASHTVTPQGCARRTSNTFDESSSWWPPHAAEMRTQHTHVQSKQLFFGNITQQEGQKLGRFSNRSRVRLPGNGRHGSIQFPPPGCGLEVGRANRRPHRLPCESESLNCSGAALLICALVVGCWLMPRTKISALRTSTKAKNRERFLDRFCIELPGNGRHGSIQFPYRGSPLLRIAGLCGRRAINTRRVGCFDTRVGCWLWPMPRTKLQLDYWSNRVITYLFAAARSYSVSAARCATILVPRWILVLRCLIQARRRPHWYVPKWLETRTRRRAGAEGGYLQTPCSKRPTIFNISFSCEAGGLHRGV